jgi:hypothetical protein
MTGCDVFALLITLWLHDAGMSPGPDIERREKASAAFIEQLQRYARLGQSEAECWRDYVRAHHPSFCEDVLRESMPPGSMAGSELSWIAKIAESHGHARIHDRTEWPKEVAVGPGESLHPTIIAVLLRLADILHFDRERAPAFLMEHRHVSNAVSLQHWRAHQACDSYVIDDDENCHFDGRTSDDEAFWYAQEFVTQVSKELDYCRTRVLPTLDGAFRYGLRLSRVHFRINAVGFDSTHPVQIGIDAAPLLGSLLQDALYSGKPVWLRELLQNAFDATRDRGAAWFAGPMGVHVVADMAVGTVEVTDNGIGMQRHVVERFLLTAGASYWAAAEYRASRSSVTTHVGRFGVGFLSVFGVADEVRVRTRHNDETSGWLFLIRSPDRFVRVEKSTALEVGTSICLKLRDPATVIGGLDELFAATVASPEVACSLTVDGALINTVSPGPTPWPAVSAPQPERAVYDIESRTSDGLFVRVGIPKLRFDALSAFVMALSRYTGRLPGESYAKSSIHYGGIQYPNLLLDQAWGFHRFPSSADLQVVASPQRYALEMNLARERFVTSDGTVRLFHDVAAIVDEVLAHDLRGTLASTDGLSRSTITALHIESGLGSFSGEIGAPGHYLGQMDQMRDLTVHDPWQLLNELFLNEVRFGVRQDGADTLTVMTAGELVRGGRAVFGVGTQQPRSVSTSVLEAIWEFDPNALVVVVNPSQDTSLLTLRKWATRELLVPVPAHARTAFGFRLSIDSQPFQLKRQRFDDLGLPTAWGPPELAVLDFRDQMMEYHHVTGGPTIHGVLNLANPRVTGLLQQLRLVKGSGPRAPVQKALKALRVATELGSRGNYKRNAGQAIVCALNGMSVVLGRGDLKFEARDAPSYFEGGTSVQIGGMVIWQIAARALAELHRAKEPMLTWS